VGAFFVAIFHVLTHAFFKACLFLGSGSVIHSMEHVEHELEDEGHDMSDFDPQDMRTMGGLQKYMPSTGWTYWIATIAISGIPLTAGFFSKDEILFKAFEYGYNGEAYAWFVWIVGVLTAALTAFYMVRSYVLTFEGEERWPEADTVHAHESASSMTIPLWILAAGSLTTGFLGIPAVIAHGDWNWIHHYLGTPYGGPVAEPELAAHVPLGLEWGLIALSSVIAIGVYFFARNVYRAHGLEYDAALQERFGGLYRLWQGKYYWDEAYDRVVVRPLIEGSRKGLWPFDDYVVDGIVNGLARLTQGLSGVLRRIQTGVVQNYALAIVAGVVLVITLMLFG
jgi:NADH-quinone oxidoreductase subunit L